MYHACMSPRFPILALTLLATGARAAERRGQPDLRAVDADAGRSFLDGGLGKTRYDKSAPTIGIGQAVLSGDVDVLDTVGARVEVSADDKHHGIVDVREACLEWLSRSLAVMAEWPEVQSERPARVQVRERPGQTDRSVTAPLRWRF